MFGKKRAPRPPIDLFPWFVVILGGLCVWASISNTADLVRARERIERLESRNQGLVKGTKDALAKAERRIGSVERRVSTLKADLDVCHARAGDIWGALEVVARTVPGRARPPRIPERKRPGREQKGPFRERRD
jgi:hypothetical protein